MEEGAECGGGGGEDRSGGVAGFREVEGFGGRVGGYVDAGVAFGQYDDFCQVSLVVGIVGSLTGP
ncbi:hypothetical protein SAV31267_052350 [Streptomyces avermitilis]|uniref:Uncharacterized protein n=1 Tax=Streptomyces avermitilis TaxID=33903 RepID=A0A4D4MU99_STRAX|nr:hypothetical protein SAV31267_052350 [Streptomyces avermitilis]